MERLLIFIVLTFLFPFQVEDLVLKGRIALSNGNYEEAIEYFDIVIKSDPNHENAMLLRSQANYSLNKYKLVIKDCEKILQINPQITTQDDITAIWNLGVSYTSLRQFKTARTYFFEAINHEPDNTKLYENIGLGYIEEKDYDLALEQFQKMVSIDIKSDKGYYGIGRVYYLKKEYENSIKAFDSAIEINPNYTMAYQNRGSAKLEMNDKDGCCSDWTKCLELGYTKIKPFIKLMCN
jgi:tetratricopeptide (TPR) repeat protein